MSMKIVQTAGRELLGDFAPEFAHYNDDVLLGENWNNEDIDIKTRCADTEIPDNLSAFPVGEPNPYGQFFTGQSYLAMLTTEQVPTFNVTFEPGCRNNWHIHHVEKGGGQILIVTAGEGYYQEWGKPAQRIRKGDTVNIPAGVKHWHGAAPGCWFQHLAVEVPGEGTRNEWLEPVDDAAYRAATGEK